MSVLIKGMEMPKSCSVCRLFGEYGCPFIGAVGYALTIGERNEDCPLVLVPPHGALMDRDDFFVTCPELVDGYKTITDGLVVLPAEEGE